MTKDPKFHTNYYRLSEYKKGAHGRRWFDILHKRTANRGGESVIYTDYVRLLLIEWHFGVFEKGFSLALSVGNAGSETPFDWHINILGQKIYFNTGLGRKLAHWLTSRKGGYHSKVISLSKWHEGTDLRWQIWAEKHEWSSDTPKWRDGHFDLSIKDRLWGPLRYEYADVKKADTEICFENEGCYPATLTLKTSTLLRTKSRRVYDESLVIDIDAPRGIPTHYDKSGGWKGDRTYGWGIKWPADFLVDDSWLERAQRLVYEDVMRTRKKTGFTEPQEEETANG